MDSNKKRIFVSYAHRDRDYALPLIEGLKSYAFFSRLEVWEDSRLFVGDNWHGRIQAELDRADIAVLLVSRHFMDSAYIREQEVKKLLRNATLLFPVYLLPCDFKRMEGLAVKQFFKPAGHDYGKPQVPDFSFADLFSDHDWDASRPVRPNPHRERYFRDLAGALERALQALGGEGPPPAPGMRADPKDTGASEPGNDKPPAEEKPPVVPESPVGRQGKPEWAHAGGEDQYGKYAVINLKGKELGGR